MSSRDKFFSMLSLAQKAGKLAVGENRATECIRGGGTYLILLALDASSNTQKRFGDMSAFRKVPLIRPGNRQELGRAIGRREAVSIAVTDPGFAAQLLRLHEQ